MKQVGFVILFVCILALKVQAQANVMAKRATINFESISKNELLDTLGQMLDVHFSYNPVLLKANDTLSADFKRATLDEVLKSVIEQTEMDYKIIGSQVVFFHSTQSLMAADTSMCFNFSGVVFDQSGQEPIPYCNVSFKDLAIGTMTNMGGRFSMKIPTNLQNDTLVFSSLGYETLYLSVREISDSSMRIKLRSISYKIKAVDVFNYSPEFIFKKYKENINTNYENENVLLTAFYRELTKQDESYTNISEAVVNILKAPYNQYGDDAVRLLKGRKAADVKSVSDIRFTLMGGPYYITKLDVVKNNESFLNAEFREFYSYKFDRVTLINNRSTAVVHFKPVYNLRDMLFEGTLYFDTETWALARVEFGYTRAGLKESKNALIQKKPFYIKATPRELKYVVQYKAVYGKWYFRSARSVFEIRIRDRNKSKTKEFLSTSEIITTQVEKGNIENFKRKETFRSNEIFTEKIKNYDQSFWENYNVIEPEEELIKALRNFDKSDMVLRFRN